MVETREITQVLIWKLILNPMCERTEAATLVAWSDDKEKLIQWYKSQLVEPYTDSNWHKVFAKNGVLEWYNPTNIESDGLDHWSHGITNEWVNQDILESVNVGYRVF